MKTKLESKRCYIFERFIISVLSIFLINVVLHFLYEKTGFKLFSIVSAVNESVWEHMKIAFYAALIYAIYEWVFKFCPCDNKLTKNIKNNFCVAKYISITMIPFLIMMMYYTYVGCIGKNIFIVDILINIIAICISQFTYLKILNSEDDYINLCTYGLRVIIVLIVTFTVFTYYPPHISLFLDKTTNTYGIDEINDMKDNNIYDGENE